MKVVNVGSLNLDRTYRLQEFVRPGETVRALAYEQHCGGKGLNQSIALARGGAETWHVGMVGPEGSRLVDVLREAGVNTEHIGIAGSATGHAVIQVNGQGQNNIIVFGGANECVAEKHVCDVLAQCEPGDFVLAQNETSATGIAIERAHELGLKVILNPSPMDERVFALRLDLVDIFMVNWLEAVSLASNCADEGSSLGHGELTLEKVAGLLSDAYPAATFVLTLGEEGSVLFDAEGIKGRCPAFKVDAIDTTGAGDTFCGFYLAELMRGEEGLSALRWASAASAIAVGRHGASTSIPSRLEVEQFVSQQIEEAMQ